MNNEQLSIQKVAYLLIVICLFFYILMIGKSILVPLTFAAVLAFLLKPICQRVENFIKIRPLAIAVSFLAILVPLVGVIMMFSFQFVDIFQNMSSIESKINAGIDQLVQTFNAQFGFSKRETEDMISENSSAILEAPLGYIGSTLTISSTFLLNLFLTFIYTFLFLLYRGALKQFYLMQFGNKIKEGAEIVLRRVELVIQKYLSGLVTVIIVLGAMNSIGLYFIGIDYPIFWGYLASFLAVIPYLGTFLGSVFPVLYALASTNGYTQPLLVMAWFSAMQVLEGNLITPKIVGSSVKINPLAAIISLLLGASIWGVAGMILSLPIIAIVRIVFFQIDYLKPFSLLLSSELYDKEETFEKKFDFKQFRISNFLRKK